MCETQGWDGWKRRLGVLTCPSSRSKDQQQNEGGETEEYKCAYLRSVTQSLLCSRPSNIVAGNKTLEWLCASFVRDRAGVSAQEMQRQIDRLAEVERELERKAVDAALAAEVETEGKKSEEELLAPIAAVSTRQPVLSGRITWLNQQLAGYVANYLCTLCQNGPRSHRNLAKAYRSWAVLGDEYAALADEILIRDAQAGACVEAIFAAVQATTMEMMMEIVFRGVQLELYAQHEWEPAYWLVAFLLSEKVGLLSEGIAQAQTHNLMVMDEEKRRDPTALQEDLNITQALFSTLRAVTVVSPTTPHRKSLNLHADDSRHDLSRSYRTSTSPTAARHSNQPYRRARRKRISTVATSGSQLRRRRVSRISWICFGSGIRATSLHCCTSRRESRR